MKKVFVLFFLGVMFFNPIYLMESQLGIKKWVDVSLIDYENEEIDFEEMNEKNIVSDGETDEKFVHLTIDYALKPTTFFILHGSLTPCFYVHPYHEDDIKPPEFI